MDFRKILFGLAAASALALTGCSSPCDADSECSKDSEPSDSDRQNCEDALDGDCGSQFDDYLTCFQDNQVCTDDKTDPVKTMEKCKKEAEALQKCCGENSGAKGCGG